MHLDFLVNIATSLISNSSTIKVLKHDITNELQKTTKSQEDSKSTVILANPESILQVVFRVLRKTLYIASDFILPNLQKNRIAKRNRREGNRKNIFISYRRADSDDVSGRIYDRLLSRFNKENIFKDVDSIPLGVDFRMHLENKVRSCSVLIAIIGKDWLNVTDGEGNRRLDNSQDFVRIEIESALERDIPVIPVLVQGGKIPEKDALPSRLKELAYRNGIAVRADPDFHNDMDRLIRGIESLLNQS